MSPIALPIAELKPALTGLGKIIAKRVTLPVLNHVKIERTAEGWIALTATDLDRFITVRLEQPSTGEPLHLLVPHDELLKITKNCPKTDNLLISPNGTHVVLQYAIGNQVAEAKVESLPVEEFPSIPQIKGDSIPVNETLRQSIHEALQCASDDETRLILNGAYIDTTKKDAHYIVGTDGRHLYSSNSFSLPLKQSLIIPSHKFIEWKEFNCDGEWQLKVMRAEKKDEAAYLQISTRRWNYITRQIEGNYPNWRQVIPNASPKQTTVKFDPDSIDAVVQIIERMPCDDALNFAIGLEWKQKKLSLLGHAPDADQPTKVEIDSAKCMGGEVTAYLNRHLFIKALQFGLTTLEIIDARSPLRFSNEGRQMIVMPIRRDPKPPTDQPAASPPAAQEEKTPMPKPAITNGKEPEAEKTTLETALEKVETIKGSYREAIRGLNDLTDALKQIQREQKNTDKEVQSVRSTLERLQSVKL